MAKKPQKPNLSSQELRELRSQLHHLKPIVVIGTNGLTDAVLQEISRALDDHELIKIRTNITDRDERNQITEEVCAKSSAHWVQTIGHIIAIYRKNLQAEETL
jgi:RNA-binding protein